MLATSRTDELLMRQLGSIQTEGAHWGPFFMATALAAAAIAGPALVPIARYPLPSMHTESFAILAWGLWLAWLLPRIGRGWTAAEMPRQAALVCLLAVLGISLLAVAVSVGWRALPTAIGVRYAAILLAAVVALLAGARLAGIVGSPIGTLMAKAVLLAFLAVGLCSACIALLQYVGIHGPWEPLGKDGRAGANLAQPNLLGTQLLWAVAALVALVELRYIPRWPARAAAALLIAGLAFSASRSAAVSCMVLVLWGLMDRHLGREARCLLFAAPAALAFAWFALEMWHGLGGPGFAGTGLLQKADPTSSRWRIWLQCARLVAENPWFGVGWGQFNFAWTLTPMPGLSRTAGYTFTHTHNIIIQWAVELGVPLAVLVAGLLAFALQRALRECWRGSNDVPLIRSTAVAMVLVVLVHSLLEFPLWHAHFLLPTMFLFGLAVAAPRDAAVHQTRPRNAAVAPLLMALMAAFALLDYRAIADVYAPPAEAPPLEQRIVKARESLLFGHFATRFSGTMAKLGERQLESYRATVFEILDWRLLASWAQAYSESGQTDKARFLSARLREFDSPAAKSFFFACDRQPDLFQCKDSVKTYRLDDFRMDLIENSRK